MRSARHSRLGSQHHAQRHQGRDQCISTRVQGLAADVTWAAWAAPLAPARHTHARWVAGICNTAAREHLWSVAVRSAYTTASSAVVHPMMSLRSTHLVGNHCLDLRGTAVAAACSLCHDHVFPSCPDFGSAPKAQAAREYRWRRIEHLLFEC